MLEDRLHNLDDIVFSCFLPDDWLNEFRMPQHVLVYVYAGIMNVEYNGISFSVKAGQYVFLKRDQPHLFSRQVTRAPESADATGR